MCRTALLVSALAFALALATGCSAPQDRSAVPSTGSKENQQLSPAVQRPRDIRAYGNRPCDVFTIEQLEKFGFNRPPDRTITLPSGHKECVWTDSGYNGRLVVGTYPDWDVLERTYANRASLPVFEALQIAGVPAVVHQPGVGMPGCYVTVGLADRQGLDVTFTDLREPYEDPCGAARAAAEVAVGNLPPLG